jgi:acyl transferase domain-containing protein
MLEALTADDDIEKTIDSWIAKGKHDKLLTLWVNGFNVDWSRLYINEKPKRVSLPTYPFARERYWVPGAVTKQMLSTDSRQ